MRNDDPLIGRQLASFRIERVLGRPQLRLVKRQPVKAFDLFTLLVFERV